MVQLALTIFLSSYSVGLSPQSTDFQFLSGRWEGKLIQLQRGTCYASGSNSRADYPYRMILTVSPDGTFVAEPIVDAGKQDPFGRWTGKLGSDLDLNFVVPVRSRCGSTTATVLTQDLTYTG